MFGFPQSPCSTVVLRTNVQKIPPTWFCSSLESEPGPSGLPDRHAMLAPRGIYDTLQYLGYLEHNGLCTLPLGVRRYFRVIIV